MSYEQRNDNGALFKNHEKGDPGAGPNRPDYKGDGIVCGNAVWISAWIKEGKRGKFLSLAFRPKDYKHGQPTSPQSGQPATDVAGDDVPF